MRLGVLGGIAVGLIAGSLIVGVASVARGRAVTHTRLVAEDASAPLRRVAIHYAPYADPVALGVWRQLFRALPPDVEIEVEVGAVGDFDRLLGLLRASHTPHLERLHPIVVGAQITTWSRDRYAALVSDDGSGSILAPPKIASRFHSRAGDFESPYAIARGLYHHDPAIADIVFEGGDLAATPNLVFVDANLPARNLGHAAADRPTIERELERRFAQHLVWLGDDVGEVPRHHIMMYMMPLDDHTVAVGDIRQGTKLLGDTPLPLDDVEVEARRFDHAAELLVAQGFRVVRVPALVLAGAGSYVTYTNALFDRRPDGTRVVYLPTYALPALDAAGTAFWQAQGFTVIPIDVSPIYRLNGSLGCLVNVLARGM